jgi:hypothetical protein
VSQDFSTFGFVKLSYRPMNIVFYITLEKEPKLKQHRDTDPATKRYKKIRNITQRKDSETDNTFYILINERDSLTRFRGMFFGVIR